MRINIPLELDSENSHPTAELVLTSFDGDSVYVGVSDNGRSVTVSMGQLSAAVQALKSTERSVK